MSEEQYKKYNKIVLAIQEDIKTDLLLYRDRAYLLIPSQDAENEFKVISAADSTNFYISSTTRQDLSNLKEFFRKLYPCEFLEENPVEVRTDRTFTLVNSTVNTRLREFHFDSLISSIINFSKPVENGLLLYSVMIRSYTTRLSKKKRFSFIVSVSISGNESIMSDFENMITQMIRRMKKESGWKMKLTSKGHIRFRTDILTNPFCLNPFVSIPQDEL